MVQWSPSSISESADADGSLRRAEDVASELLGFPANLGEQVRSSAQGAEFQRGPDERAMAAGSVSICLPAGRSTPRR